MEQKNPDLLTDDLLNFKAKMRKELLPSWIKIFMWIFLVFGVFVPFIIFSGIIGWHPNISIYGISTNEPFSLWGIVVTAIFTLKGITSFGMFRQTDWAIKLAIVDAILGIIICMISMAYDFTNGFQFNGVSLNLRIELIFLIPYLIKMNRIKVEWQLRS
jgi:hypothetical protein